MIDDGSNKGSVSKEQGSVEYHFLIISDDRDSRRVTVDELLKIELETNPRIRSKAQLSIELEKKHCFRSNWERNISFDRTGNEIKAFDRPKKSTTFDQTGKEILLSIELGTGNPKFHRTGNEITAFDRSENKAQHSIELEKKHCDRTGNGTLLSIELGTKHDI